MSTKTRHRVRFYQRADPTRPGQQERRLQRKVGLAWCRGCRAWLPGATVAQGACRVHLNAEYRRAYAAGAKVDIAARVHARKRKVAAVPESLAVELTEQFGGACAYCPAPADTWDHLVPVSKGGQTIRGNIVPACRSCNSKKRTRPPETMPNASALLVDVLIMLDVL